MYRIISGKWKAKKIAAPRNFDVRPTTDFAKEALFSILDNKYDMQSISVLDLFAGIGSITFEFASRGCQDVTSVEMNPKHTSFLNSTASELGFSLQVNVQRGDVFDWLKKFRNKKSFEIVFSDAPFEMEEKKYYELLSLVLNNKYLKPNGILIVEHQSRLKFDHPNLIDSRKYGNVSFSFFEPNKEENTEITDNQE
ncbi:MULTISPECIES: RsmD family RNA methyltransferase [Chryseobacterium]|jgi:16S rRNA (guanine(966)-N(2))-methyltransferase RsmD|uniref:16S rRNA (Guanine(966)-N(2))-methyltransferase RsmD n=1 Tax=Chryseobacterium geocarposphaerae TaxID=1416776 RepID=A0ABU1LHG5_9FLAO|nr:MULTISPECIES: RsmD family RNA methyltransferase [Chryseobacterium]ALR29069.1 16S rRNA (guanine(966)-N(2))-methyltransferase RsmD [Chryseobacterium sp. IHB B 17019]MDR6406166.1 16S rRNA (guanine(966)-N(2))-methyltransferase RsmD [Chryseobacterium geocarposphaerae]MDR6699360.1 16S rRNA (guanine(966)-N(2))-methyltransferase RsmD [Chryseobacterium ginsenosidimutans]